MRLRPFFGLLAFLLSCTFCQRSIGQAKQAELEIKEAMQKGAVVGLSVVVVKDGKVIYTNAFGQKNIELSEALKPNHLFRIASISKSFSTTALLQLVEAGKLKLEDDFSKLVGFTIRNPKFPDVPITVKMVLAHRSSINDSQGYFTLDAINPAKNPDFAKCYNDYKPGEKYQYCNLNFNMVGTIIEKLSNERFDQAIKHRVLDPLKLYGGYCVDSLDTSLFATLYEFDSGKYVPSPQAYAPRREEIKNYVMGYSTPIFSPTGGMKISAPGLAKYMMMHMNCGKLDGVRIISRKSSKRMQAKQSNELGYALSLMNLDDLIPGKTMTGHTGSAYGLYSAMFFHPKEKFGFVAITNGCNTPETDAMNALLKTTINILYNNFIR